MRVMLCKNKGSEVMEYALSRSLSPAMISACKTQLSDKNIYNKKYMNSSIRKLTKKKPLLITNTPMQTVPTFPFVNMRILNRMLNSTILLTILISVCSCKGQNPKSQEKNTGPEVLTTIGDTVLQLGTNIDCMFQDKDNTYWFASNGDGVYRYDGKTLTHITEKHGLVSNFVLKIAEDAMGDLWFSTRDGVCSFNGVSFTNHTDAMKKAPNAKLQYVKGGLFFNQLNGLCFYDGKSFSRFSIHPETYSPSPADMNRPYSVYATLVDNKGNVWFGTQEKGVCLYDGNSFTFFTDHGLDKAAVRTLFQDKAGNIWAGNNGAGLFKLNGKSFSNITDEKGLANHDFLKTLTAKGGTLARPWTINEDNNGNLWIGTIDAGVWKFDGTNLVNYTVKDGLSGKAIWTIYKDQRGELWFVTDGDALCRFNGKTFTKFEF
jgi:ligand-binding sensor domain-containing protein